MTLILAELATIKVLTLNTDPGAPPARPPEPPSGERDQKEPRGS